MIIMTSKDMNVEVTWEDQKHINQFSRCNLKATSLETVLANKKQELEYLEDCLSELELYSEDDRLNYKIGDLFVQCSAETAMKRLNQAKEELTGEIDELDERFSALNADLNKLKALLYGKFKNAINLERD